MAPARQAFAANRADLKIDVSRGHAWFNTSTAKPARGRDCRPSPCDKRRLM